MTKIPKGIVALFFIFIFASLAYAVLYSSLELFMQQGLHLSVLQANAILGGFLAFNYGLHLLGGYFGGRFLSFRNLFVMGMLFQIFGCILLSQVSFFSLLWGMALFLTGSGLNVTCINMMVTQQFRPEDKRRESAFLWNYSGMNLGFWIGYAMAGYFQLTANYHQLFLLCSIANIIAIAIILFNWNKLKDRDTFLVHMNRHKQTARGLIGILIMVLMVPIIHLLLEHASLSNKLVLGAGAGMGFVMLFLAFQQPRGEVRNKMFAYILLTLVSLLFWTLYQIAPIGLSTYAAYNVNRDFLGYAISPQWILNINPTVIIIGGPLMTLFLAAIRKRGIHFSIPQQFTLSLFFIGGGFLLLPLGIHFAAQNGLADFNWIFSSYILQSIGELLISPIGYAMIGQLAPASLSAIMMGTWMMVNGAGGVLSSYASTWAIGNSTSNNPLITNPGYGHVFTMLGWGAVGVGVVLWLLIPRLKKLINEKSLLNNTSLAG